MHLREFRKEDAKDVALNADNSRVAQFLPEVFPAPYTLEAAQWWVTEGHKLANTYNRAVVVDGECAGSIGATFFDGEYRFTAKLGYWIGEPHWGKGIMTEALTQFASQLFDELEVKRLYAPVVEKNVASISVLRKAGFTREAVFRDNVYLRGAFHIEHVYAKYS